MKSDKRFPIFYNASTWLVNSGIVFVSISIVMSLFAFFEQGHHYPFALIALSLVAILSGNAGMYFSLQKSSSVSNKYLFELSMLLVLVTVLFLCFVVTFDQNLIVIGVDGMKRSVYSYIFEIYFIAMVSHALIFIWLVCASKEVK